MKRFLAAIPTAVLIAAASPGFAAASDDTAADNEAFVFGGALTADDMQRSALPLAADYDGNGILGVGM